MAKLGTLTVSVGLAQRKAIYTPSKLNAVKYNLVGRKVDVGVFGLFQVKEEDDVDAYFVVELPNGSCCYARVDQIQFVDKEEETE